MGSIIVTAPDIPESELVFSDDETRDILKFFWPNLASGIDAMVIDTETRRLAQMLLIAAIDASYAMGFVEALFTTVAKPGRSLGAMGKKLATKFVKHWWKHATQTDLMNAKVYDSIRKEVARQCRTAVDMRLHGIAKAAPLHPFYMVVSTTPVLAWG